jgi:2-polyprenyl-6-methoxyphenol hydroxylase-like FAD-dependent oxidoreductase
VNILYIGYEHVCSHLVRISTLLRTAVNDGVNSRLLQRATSEPAVTGHDLPPLVDTREEGFVRPRRHARVVVGATGRSSACRQGLFRYQLE